jgi:glycosyltransferase involved in cell wall biosynthesis
LLFVAKQRFADKGGELAMAAFAIARGERPDLELVVMGDESYPARFAGVPGVTGKGRVSYDELKETFARSTLLFMPAEREPWGLVYLEAMSARTPVLMLDRMSGRELTRNGSVGYLATDPSPRSVANCLLEALSDLDGLERRARAAYTHVHESYSWKNVASTILNMVKAGDR